MTVLEDKLPLIQSTFHVIGPGILKRVCYKALFTDQQHRSSCRGRWFPFLLEVGFILTASTEDGNFVASSGSFWSFVGRLFESALSWHKARTEIHTAATQCCQALLESKLCSHSSIEEACTVMATTLQGGLAMATQRRDGSAMAPLGTEAKQEGGEELTSVQALAESGLQAVPARFIRPEQELASFCPHTSLCLEPIPMIDLEGLQDFRRQFTMAAISSACRHWGCFQILNHKIPQSILDDALRAAREFFEMPLREKQAYKMDLSAPNSSGYGMQSSEEKDKVLDWGDVMFHKNMDKLPAHPATYKNAMDAYARETRKVLELVLDVMSKELRLVPTYFRNVFGDFEQPLRVNYYPPCPQPELVLGLRTHTDPIVLTALLEDQTRGLQIKNGDKWVTVDPEPDALVIFVGDQLQISSNNHYKAVSHRAVVNKKNARISIAMGLAPNANVRVRPAVELVDKSATTRYEPRTYGEFRAALPNGVRW